MKMSMNSTNIEGSAIYLFSLRQFYFHFWPLLSILASYQQYLLRCYRNEHLHQQLTPREHSPSHRPIHLKII